MCNAIATDSCAHHTTFYRFSAEMNTMHLKLWLTLEIEFGFSWFLLPYLANFKGEGSETHPLFAGLASLALIQLQLFYQDAYG